MSKKILFLMPLLLSTSYVYSAQVECYSAVKVDDFNGANKEDLKKQNVEDDLALNACRKEFKMGCMRHDDGSCSAWMQKGSLVVLCAKQSVDVPLSEIPEDLKKLPQTGGYYEHLSRINRRIRSLEKKQRKKTDLLHTQSRIDQNKARLVRALEERIALEAEFDQKIEKYREKEFEFARAVCQKINADYCKEANGVGELLKGSPEAPCRIEFIKDETRILEVKNDLAPSQSAGSMKK